MAAVAAATAALSTDSTSKNPAKRLPEARAMEQEARELEARAKKLRAAAAEIEALAAVQKAPIPWALETALGDNLKRVTYVSPSKKLLELRIDEHDKMPANFVKTADGCGPGFLLVCASVGKNSITKIVAVFQRWRNDATIWNQGGDVFASQPVWNAERQGFEPRKLEATDYQKFGDLLAGKGVADEKGIVWRRI